MSTSNSSFIPPDWAFAFHGHRCPFMPLGFRMSEAALAALGVGREQDHTLRVVAELGDGHPQTCLMEPHSCLGGWTGATRTDGTHEDRHRERR